MMTNIVIIINNNNNSYHLQCFLRHVVYVFDTNHCGIVADFQEQVGKTRIKKLNVQYILFDLL